MKSFLQVLQMKVEFLWKLRSLPLANPVNHTSNKIFIKSRFMILSPICQFVWRKCGPLTSISLVCKLFFFSRYPNPNFPVTINVKVNDFPIFCSSAIIRFPGKRNFSPKATRYPSDTHNLHTLKIHWNFSLRVKLFLQSLELFAFKEENVENFPQNL